MPRPSSSNALGPHGSPDLPEVTVTGYNIELKDDVGFIGDRASKRAFAAILEEIRQKLRDIDQDPLGDEPTADLTKRRLDRLLLEGSPDEAGLVHGAVEEFAQKLAGVIRRFLRQRAWRETTRIAVGGGLRQSRVGELTIGRASVLLKTAGIAVDLVPIANHPDQAGLIGALHLAPRWMFSGHDAILAVDIGGTNIRCGIVVTNLADEPSGAAAAVWKSELWRHRDDQPTREAAVDRLGQMLRGLIEDADRKKISLAPFVGIGCPGVIRPDGTIEKGSQNLPGNWESNAFHLPSRITEALPRIGGHAVSAILHNDAVVQGLSELPRMRDAERWAAVTIGTGLGNASFAAKAEAP